MKEEILRIGVLAGYDAFTRAMVNRFHNRVGRLRRIKFLHRPIWKPEEPVAGEIPVEGRTCNPALVINAGSLG